MKNDAFFDLLLSMEKDQFKRFEKYIRVYIGEEHQAIQLFEQYSQLRKAQTQKPEGLSRDLLFDTFITQKKLQVTRKHLSNLISLLSEVLKKFLISEQLQQDTASADYFLAELLLERGLLEHLDSHFKKAIDRLNKQLPGVETELHLSRLYYLRYFSLGLEQNERYDQNAKASMIYLDEYYLSRKLKWASELVNREKILGNQYSIRFLPSILQEIEKTGTEQLSDYQALYWHALALLQKPDEATYQALKEQWSQQWPSIPRDEVANILNLLNNHNARLIKNGVDRFAEAYDITKKTLESGAIHEMNANFILNGINICIDNEDMVRATQLLDLLCSKFAEEKEAIVISKARIALQMEQYETVLKLLPDHQQFPTFSLGIRARLLKVQAYFELQDSEALENAIRSFELFCAREKKNPSLNQETLDAVGQLILFLRKLVKLAPWDKKGHQNLLENVLESPKIAAKLWLLRTIKARC